MDVVVKWRQLAEPNDQVRARARAAGAVFSWGLGRGGGAAHLPPPPFPFPPSALPLSSYPQPLQLANPEPSWPYIVTKPL